MKTASEESASSNLAPQACPEDDRCKRDKHSAIHPDLAFGPTLTPDFCTNFCIKELQKIKCCVALHLRVK